MQTTQKQIPTKTKNPIPTPEEIMGRMEGLDYKTRVQLLAKLFNEQEGLAQIAQDTEGIEPQNIVKAVIEYYNLQYGKKYLQ